MSVSIETPLTIPPEPPLIFKVDDQHILSWISNIDKHQFTQPINIDILSRDYITLQADGDTNRSVTSNKELFTIFLDIPDYT